MCGSADTKTITIKLSIWPYYDGRRGTAAVSHQGSLMLVIADGRRDEIRDYGLTPQLKCKYCSAKHHDQPEGYA